MIYSLCIVLLGLEMVTWLKHPRPLTAIQALGEVQLWWIMFVYPHSGRRGVVGDTHKTLNGNQLRNTSSHCE